MQAVNVSTFHANGRIQGSYVYMLMCLGDGDRYHIKVGMSDKPMDRFFGILTSLPFEPVIFAIAELPTRKMACAVETELHTAFERWHAAREWFEFFPADKASFNEAWQGVFRSYSKPSWKVTWTQLSASALLK
jgi:hypothetical protein